MIASHLAECSSQQLPQQKAICAVRREKHDLLTNARTIWPNKWVV